MLPSLDEIKKKRKLLQLSQRELAKELGLSQSAIAKIENRTMRPTYELVDRIFTHLDSATASNMGAVKDVASNPVVSVGRHEKVKRAVEIFRARGFKQIPVRNGNSWVGSISERSISRHMLETRNPALVLRKRVSEIMDEVLPIIPENAPVSNVVPLLQHAQAILTARRGRVVGIVTNADLLKVLTKLS